ncbi:MAG: hypothetical protein LBS60_07685, partial [Deltaproteobacteria bacterium]|nr:hypothetical protein [Deltaproteobacteria bacterium]
FRLALSITFYLNRFRLFSFTLIPDLSLIFTRRSPRNLSFRGAPTWLLSELIQLKGSSKKRVALFINLPAALLGFDVNIAVESVPIKL